MYELVIIWWDDEKEIYQYPTKEQAERAGREMCFAFGKQITWHGVRKAVK